ncbi:DedA family protein [Novosphingobium sp.]|uniref:DedA family protein n=1 Tax=Novosphingobium sp. TaxID=1874826 RepID=UPI0027364F82|nr:DedA family protein [Novosphingobium sp.]MDP3905694.1 DedA family protein [Novosphingobium sp.]
MTDWILELIERGGYWGIFLLMIIENVFPPIPSEVIMGLGGVAVARGTMSFWPLLLVGTIGSTLGNYVWFMAGERLGYRRLKPLIERWGRVLTVDWEDVERGTALFRRHGHWIVFALRFSPLLRTIISLPAGLIHMPRVKFLAFTFAGAAVWNSALILGGQMAAEFLDTSKTIAEWVIGGMLAATLIAYVWRVVTWKPRG